MINAEYIIMTVWLNSITINVWLLNHIIIQCILKGSSFSFVELVILFWLDFWGSLGAPGSLMDSLLMNISGELTAHSATFRGCSLGRLCPEDSTTVENAEFTTLQDALMQLLPGEMLQVCTLTRKTEPQ